VSRGVGGQSQDPQAGFGTGGLSADGRFVVFDSPAADFVDGDTNGHTDIFVRDRRAGRTTRVSPGVGGAQADSDSDNRRSRRTAGTSRSPPSPRRP
jgi:Tol biopolymer transport system component